MSEPQPNAAPLPDGVYMGFNIPGEQGKSIPHPWIEVVQDGKPTTFEYGPEGNAIGGIGSKTIEMNQTYGDSDRNAGALFALSPPPGMSTGDFTARALRVGEGMNELLRDSYVPYIPAVAADCDTASLAMLQTLGGSVAQFESMTLTAKNGNAGSAGFTDLGGASIALSPEALAVTAGMSLALQTEVGADPHVPIPGLGTIGVRQLDRGERERWGEPLTPHPNPAAGHAPERRAAALPDEPRPSIDVASVQAGVDRLLERGTSLPPVRTVEAWNGTQRAGSFVDVADGVVAQHVGRGAYLSYDVGRDLGGVSPPIGRYVELEQSGTRALENEPPSLGRA